MDWLTKDYLAIPVEPSSVHFIKTPTEFYDVLSVRKSIFCSEKVMFFLQILAENCGIEKAGCLSCFISGNGKTGTKTRVCASKSLRHESRIKTRNFIWLFSRHAKSKAGIGDFFQFRWNASEASEPKCKGWFLLNTYSPNFCFNTWTGSIFHETDRSTKQNRKNANQFSGTIFLSSGHARTDPACFAGTRKRTCWSSAHEIFYFRRFDPHFRVRIYQEF